MNIYSLIKKANSINSPRLKLLGIYAFHITKRRYIGIFLDPVLTCNLRCKMCYFSDENKRKEYKGILQKKDITKIGNALFHRGLKLQIGCGAEPASYIDLEYIITLAKEKGVPYVSITTNGLLLNKQSVIKYLKAGLDEITISMHGVSKETYEYFMTNADYEQFCSVLQMLTELKNTYKFKLRINYTMNESNLSELGEFFEYFDSVKFDVLQLRPIEKIGNSEYNNFTHGALIEEYDSTIQKVKEESQRRNILCIAPSKNQIQAPEGHNNHAVVMESTYCYISPRGCWEDDFNYETDTFESYAKKRHLGRELLLNVFRTTESLNKRKKSLNYELS